MVLPENFKTLIKVIVFLDVLLRSVLESITVNTEPFTHNQPTSCFNVVWYTTFDFGLLISVYKTYEVMGIVLEPICKATAIL